MKPCAHRTNDHQICVKCGQVMGLELSNKGARRTPQADEITTAELSSGVSLRYPNSRVGTADRILLTIKDKARTAGEIREALHRGARWRGKHRWRERGLRQALIKIDKLTEKLSLPNTVQEEVAYLYRKCQRENLNLGHSTSITLGALIYAVGRMRCISRTTGEVCEAIGDDKEKLLHKEVRRLTKALNLELPIKGTTELAKEYLPRFATKLGLGKEAVRKGLAILDNNGHTNQHPAVLAGAVLYVVAKPPAKGIPLNVIVERLGVGAGGLSRTARSLEFSTL